MHGDAWRNHGLKKAIQRNTKTEHSHFWQTSITKNLHDKCMFFFITMAQYPVRWTGKPLYISPPERPVLSDINSTYLGSIQPRCIYCANTIQSHFHHCLCTHSCSIQNHLRRRGENENVQASKQDQSGSIESLAFYR